jgi:hypothetical protein
MKFYYHYNKPMSQRKGIPIISLHYKDQCHFIRELDCQVPTKSRFQKRQPRYVMTGNAKRIIISRQGVATIL